VRTRDANSVVVALQDRGSGRAHARQAQVWVVVPVVARLGFGRIVVSEKEVPIMLVNMV
jgi:hypothetical protein